MPKSTESVSETDQEVGEWRTSDDWQHLYSHRAGYFIKATFFLCTY